MVSNYDRYYQLARCFRDEDLRKDRQPEHTQIDMEMSFIGEEDIMGVVEGMIAHVFKHAKKLDIPLPLRRMSYREAMDKYGCDKPDLRYGMEIRNLTPVFEKSGFRVFDETIANGGEIRGLSFTPPAGVEFSRKDFDDLTKWLQQDFGVKGLAWLKVTGLIRSNRRSRSSLMRRGLKKWFKPQVRSRAILSLSWRTSSKPRLWRSERFGAFSRTNIK